MQRTFPGHLPFYSILNYPWYKQAGNQGGRRPLENFFTPLEKYVGHSLKLLDIILKIGPLSENSSLLLVSQAGYGPDYKPYDIVLKINVSRPWL